MFQPGRKSIVTVICTLLVLSSCGGGGGGYGGSGNTVSNYSSSSASNSSTSSIATTLTGVFVDSPVAGLHYKTATQEGNTNTLGKFSYMQGENIVFSIGDIVFPSVKAGPIVSPFDLAGTTNVSDVSLINMTRLLQSLDLDGDATNGISIGDKASMYATGVNIDFADPNFANNVDIINLVANSGSVNTTLIDSTSAINQLQASINPQTGCLKTQPYVGRVATLSTNKDNVSGTATIVDDCTIVVTNFNYDGGGPEVYFYAGTNDSFAPPVGFAIGNKINGTAFFNQTVTLTLPPGKTLQDFNSLAVWCSQHQANFGSGIFQTPP